jgi:hypothetical protein
MFDADPGPLFRVSVAPMPRKLLVDMFLHHADQFLGFGPAQWWEHLTLRHRCHQQHRSFRSGEHCAKVLAYWLDDIHQELLLLHLPDDLEPDRVDRHRLQCERYTGAVLAPGPFSHIQVHVHDRSALCGHHVTLMTPSGAGCRRMPRLSAVGLMLFPRSSGYILGASLTVFCTLFLYQVDMLPLRKDGVQELLLCFT